MYFDKIKNWLNTEAISEIVKNNCRKIFGGINKNAFKINVRQKILLNPKFLVRGNNLISNIIQKGKIIYRYTEEIVMVLGVGYYEIKMRLDITKFIIIWNNICNNIDSDLIDHLLIIIVLA